MTHVYRTLRNGARTIQKLDNSNVYCTFLFESAANIAKDGMWMKLMNVYTLMVANGDRRIVGTCITANGLTRAAFAIFAGNVVIRRLGTHTTMRIAGIAGIIGIVLNLFCFMEDSVADIYAINIVWAMFSGLSNSCLETIFARSLLIEYREEVSTVRQSLNKATTAIGPLISLTLFYFYGNQWTLPSLHAILNIGTLLTLVAVGVCFLFDDRFETRQVSSLCDIKRITLEATLPSHHSQMLMPHDIGHVTQEYLNVEALTKRDFESHLDGPAVLTYPLPPTSKYSRLKVLHKDTLEPARYIIGKQYLVRFKGLKRLQRHSIIYVTFHDRNRPGPVKATLENVTIFLSKGEEKKVDLLASKLTFMLTEDSMLCTPTDNQFSVRSLFNCCCPRRIRRMQVTDALRNSVTPKTSVRKKKKKEKEKKRYTPNIWGANVIVSCDILNALGNGMSLKFMDLFLVQEYGFSPAGLLFLQVLTNCAAVYLTPSAKLFLQWIRSKKYHGKAGVIVLWSISMTFLAIITIPGVPWWLVALCIILRNSLNTCTKAYNRAKLANYLPHDKVASYMVWDSLNKANQGGIAIFGSQLVHFGGYRLCFFATLCIMLVRLLLYLSFVVRQHMQKVARRTRMSHASHSPLLRKSASATDIAAHLRATVESVVARPASSRAITPPPGGAAATGDIRTPLLGASTLPATIEAERQLEESLEGANSATSSANEEDNFDEEARLEPDEVPSHLFRPSHFPSSDDIDAYSSFTRPNVLQPEFSDALFSDFGDAEKGNRAPLLSDDTIGGSPERGRATSAPQASPRRYIPPNSDLATKISQAEDKV